MTRVAVFIDYQNFYHGARECFGLEAAPYIEGQVYPRRVGVLLTDRGRAIDPSRRLEYVKVFRGVPSPRYSRGGQAAADRQVRFWEAQGAVTPVTRPLKYYPRNGGYEAREKGIDVLLALALVTGAITDEYDVAVVCSADTDLLPAVEQVIALGKRCEVAAWSGSGGHRSRLSLPTARIWCHWLKRSDYERVADRTDYTRAQPGEPPVLP